MHPPYSRYCVLAQTYVLTMASNTISVGVAYTETSGKLVDQNRQYLLDSGFPQAVVSLLEGYLELLPPGPGSDPLPLSISHLLVIKTAIGVLLNASLGYSMIYWCTLLSRLIRDLQIRLNSDLYRWRLPSHLYDCHLACTLSAHG